MTTVIDDIYRFDAFGQPAYVPQYSGPSIAGPSTAQLSLPPAQPYIDFPTTFVDPMATPAEIPAFTCGRKCSSTLNRFSIAYRRC